MNKIRHDFSVVKSSDSYDEWEMKSYFVSMKDGCLLETLVFFPKVKMNKTTQLEWPVLLTRTPYSHMRDELIIQGQEFAKKGVVFAFQFCRGTGGSEGKFEPNVYERQDGIDTLNWLVEMEWCGPVCLHGSSYMALTAWVVADSLPDKVLGMFVSHYGVDRYLSAYEAGLFRHDILTGWALTNCGRTFKEDESIRKLYMDGALYRPHIKADRQVWGMDLLWYRDWISQTDHDSDYWNTGFWGMLKTMPKKVNKPVFMIAGWFDHHLSGTLLAYDLLPQEVKDKSRLLVGGWNHFFDKTTGDHENTCGGFNMPKALFEWFSDLREERGLTNSEEAYCIGSDDWVNPKDIPVQDETYYFTDESIGGIWCLNPEPDDRTTSLEYRYDPENPVMSLGGETLFFSGKLRGCQLQEPVGTRADVVHFISHEFEEDRIINGVIQVQLQVSTDVEDTCFTVKICDVFPDGRTFNIRNGMTTLAYRNGAKRRGSYNPGVIVDIDIKCLPILWKIKAGHKLRVDISSSNFPEYAIHSNRPGVWSEIETSMVAHQHIYLGKEEGSRIRIPFTKG